MTKTDMGPGQSNNKFVAIARVYGAGLPNGTEPGQEVDQLLLIPKSYGTKL